ncbi:MAG: NAD(P)H-quinone oxidoreductase [Candidatus Tectomicrobia bacterium]|uniref:NAD(P)H-quinone oxidoreductase n=1 Tax=Tectimicrobiota bacterium TaxID=2528274 RepID=A0A933LPG3_UNCTE|nr:NAD(P)H-quinone oxidoreductase [Candidatus Tectomicrobia bacterium]
MKAILVEKPGGAEQLKLGKFPMPEVGEHSLLVKVKATALNRADILQREGKYPPPQGASPILGLEIAGIVETVGSKAINWKKGDKVFGLLPGGGYAEYAVIHEDMALLVPENISFEEAAAIPEVFLTAFQCLVWLAELKEGEIVLIHAGASGVGTAAIQLARESGAKIIVTASQAKHKICRQLGAELTIDYKTQDFCGEILKHTNNYGADVIIDFIGGPNFKPNILSLARDGRLIMLAVLGGGNVNEVDIRHILAKRLKIIGSTLRSRSLDYQIKLTKEFKDFAYEKIKSGRITPVIDKVFNWKDVAEAHRRMEENKNAGKIVLRVE